MQAHGILYKSVAQKVLLYGIKSWVVTGASLKVLEGFYHQAARRIGGSTARRAEEGEWEYPLLADSLESTGIWQIKEYIQRLQDTIAAQVACRPIYELCTGTEQMTGSSRMMR